MKRLLVGCLLLTSLSVFALPNEVFTLGKIEVRAQDANDRSGHNLSAEIEATDVRVRLTNPPPRNDDLGVSSEMIEGTYVVENKEAGAKLELFITKYRNEDFMTGQFEKARYAVTVILNDQNLGSIISKPDQNLKGITLNALKTVPERNGRYFEVFLEM